MPEADNKNEGGASETKQPTRARKADVPEGIKPILDAQAARTTSAERVEASAERAERERNERLEKADIGAADAEDIDASGSIMETDTKSEIDVDHPAVDNNPRAGTTVAQNRIDFNDPTQKDRDAVAERLSNQG